MKNTITIAAAIAAFVLISLIVDGNRAHVTPDQASMQSIVDARFYAHQREEQADKGNR